MSFKYVDSNALRIPGKMDLDELAFLAALAAEVPENGSIVEVGAFYGRSTNALACGNATAQITSIDTFETAQWTDRYAQQFMDVPKFDRGAFDTFTKHINHLTPIQGFSPDCARHWSIPIDMYFEDAIHGNPGFKRNMDFWVSHLKPGGIVCGHDYTRRFPDIKSEVDHLAQTWNTSVSVVGSLWALRKPARNAASSAPITIAIGTAPRFDIQVQNKRHGISKGQNGYWCGAHLDADRLDWLMIEDIFETAGIRLECRLGHHQFGTTDWVPAGQKAQLIHKNVARPFTKFAVRFSPEQPSHDWHVNYRLSARQIGKGGSRLSGTSAWASDGDWTSLPLEGPGANAITIDLSTIRPIDSQSAFARHPRRVWQDVRKAIAKKVLTRA